MDSSRSGLLSTLLMTLPLIVVPALALLRPPGPNSGVSSQSLDAASEEEESGFSVFEELDSERSSDKSDRPKSKRSESDVDLDAIFGDEDRTSEGLEDAPLFDEPKKGAVRRPGTGTERKPPSPTARDQSQDKSMTKEASPFVSEGDDPADTGNPPGGATPGDDPSSPQIVRQLNEMGAIRTMWFDAGEKTPVGLAVFFRGDTELMRYRFEAVGASRDACAREVLSQVLAWQKARSSAGQ